MLERHRFVDEGENYDWDFSTGKLCGCQMIDSANAVFHVVMGVSAINPGTECLRSKENGVRVC